MSIRLMTEVWDKAPYKQSELLILLALADSANDEGVCWPSVPTLARRGRVRDRQVQKALVRLEVDGWLQRKERAGRSTIYTVTVPEETPSYRTPKEPEPVPQDALEPANRPTGRGVLQDRGVLEDGGGVSSRTGGGVLEDTQNHKEPPSEPSSSSSVEGSSADTPELPDSYSQPYPGGGMPQARLSWYPSAEIVEGVKATYDWATDVALRSITLSLITYCKKKGRQPDDALWMTFIRTEQRDRETAERKEQEARQEEKKSWIDVAD